LRSNTAQVRTLQRRQRSVWDLMERKDKEKQINNEVLNDRSENKSNKTVAHRSESD
jgi:hypothetical protein